MPAQVNARLTKVTTPGEAVDFDRGGTGPADKWTGDKGAYYRERRERVTVVGAQAAADAGDRKVDRTLVVPTAVAIAAGVDEDDVVHFTWRDASHQRQVQLVDHRDLDDAGIPEDLRTTKLTLA